MTAGEGPASVLGASLEQVLAAVEASLELSPAGDSLAGPNVVLPGYRRVFGGQLLAQAIVAAAGRQDEAGEARRLIRSLHLVFTAEGGPEEPVSWVVQSLRDGRTFSTRTVSAHQGDRLLAAGVASLHVAEAVGVQPTHSVMAPALPSPAVLAACEPAGAMAFETRLVLTDEPLTGRGGFRVWTRRETPSDQSPPPLPSGPPALDGLAFGPPALDGLAVGPPELAAWVRAPRPPRRGNDELVHQALLAYSSDLTMMIPALRPHKGLGFGSPALEASAVTSHTISFHRQVRVDEWLLFLQDSPAAAGGCAYVRGDFFDSSGVVVASCAQEVLVRAAPDWGG